MAKKTEVNLSYIAPAMAVLRTTLTTLEKALVSVKTSNIAQTEHGGVGVRALEETVSKLKAAVTNLDLAWKAELKTRKEKSRK